MNLGTIKLIENYILGKKSISKEQKETSSNCLHLSKRELELFSIPFIELSAL